MSFFYACCVASILDLESLVFYMLSRYYLLDVYENVLYLILICKNKHNSQGSMHTLNEDILLIEINHIKIQHAIQEQYHTLANSIFWWRVNLWTTLSNLLV